MCQYCSQISSGKKQTKPLTSAAKKRKPRYRIECYIVAGARIRKYIQKATVFKSQTLPLIHTIMYLPFGINFKLNAMSFKHSLTDSRCSLNRNHEHMIVFRIISVFYSCCFFRKWCILKVNNKSQHLFTAKPSYPPVEKEIQISHKCQSLWD